MNPAEQDHNALITRLATGTDVQFVNGFPFAVDTTSDEPTTEADAEQPSEPPAAEFDGGAREPAPAPTDPVADHNQFVTDFAAMFRGGDG